MHVQTTTRLMIARSRNATREMLDYARRAVQRAQQLGWTILVGDNPKGVDMTVVQECRRLKAKVIVAGIADGLHARIDGLTSLAVLFAVGGTIIGLPILDPIIGLLIRVVILFITRDASRRI